jgi:uncharacterized membrane protein
MIHGRLGERRRGSPSAPTIRLTRDTPGSECCSVSESVLTRPRTRASRWTVDGRLRTAIALLSLVGIGISGYLTYVHYTGLHVLCLSSGGCETVQSSQYASLAGLPVATLGLAGYIAILVTAAPQADIARLAGFGLALVGALFSAYLTYREIFTINAICQWCVASALLMTLLAMLTATRAVRDDTTQSHPIDPRP